MPGGVSRPPARPISRSRPTNGTPWVANSSPPSPDQARDAYRRALELNPALADAHVNLGRLLQEEGAAGAAIEQYRAALDTEPHHATAAFNLGIALEDLGRRQEAIAAYQQALSAEPDFADAHYNLAQLYEKTGRKQAALRHLAQYKRLAEE